MPRLWAPWLCLLPAVALARRDRRPPERLRLLLRPPRLGGERLVGLVRDEVLDPRVHLHEPVVHPVPLHLRRDVDDLLDPRVRPGRHHPDPGPEEQRLLDVVGDEEHRHLVLLPDAAKLLLEHVAVLGVQGREGLVHDEHPRVVREHARELDPLAHPPRQLVRVLVPLIGEADEAQELVAHPGPLGRARPAEPLAELDVLAGRQPLVEGVVGLEDDPAVARRAANPLPLELHRPVRRLLEPCEDVEDRRLAAAARAQEAEEVVGGEVEVDPVEGGEVLVGAEEGLGEAGDVHQALELVGGHASRGRGGDGFGFVHDRSLRTASFMAHVRGGCSWPAHASPGLPRLSRPDVAHGRVLRMASMICGSPGMKSCSSPEL